MYLKCNRRIKDGKEHRYWSIMENRRCAGGRVVQRPVLYLGEINDSQREAWIRSIEVFDEDHGRQEKLALFASDREVPAGVAEGVQVRLSEFVLKRPRQWGACWLFSQLWEELGLREFWQERLGVSREGTDWEHVLQLLSANRLIAPGSEWHLHRHWYAHSAMGDLLGEDDTLGAKDTLYRCLDLLLAHKQALFDHLSARWQDLFGAKFDVLLYDLTSTYFESDPPEEQDGKRRFGYSRDKRPDCVQVVIALIVTPEGFPLAYEVLPGNTADKTTLGDFLKKIEDQYGKAQRIWIMDRGIPTEEVLSEMRKSQPPVYYLVGTPKGRLGHLEKDLAQRAWEAVRQGVEVKLLAQDGELYVLAQSRDRICKERAIRRRQLKKLWKRLKQLQAMKLSAKDLLLKLGEARGHYRAAWRLIDFKLPEAESKSKESARFCFALNRKKLRDTRRREGRYLLRSNLCEKDPALLWRLYTLLTQIEEAFKNLKGDLAIRPIFHQLENRIEAHIFVAFLAYCLHVTLHHRLRQYAPGLTPRAVLEKFAAIQMLDAHFPTTDGRWLIFARYTQPEKDHRLLLAHLGLQLPPQSPPRITAKGDLLDNLSQKPLL
jgi:transposase